MANISFHYGHGGDTVAQLKAVVDLDGDGHADAGLIDFPGSSGAGRDIAFDSNGDGKVDLILVDADGDGNYDTGYSDPGGSGAWAAHSPMEAGRLLTMFPELGDAPDPAPLPGAEHVGDPAAGSPTAGGSPAAADQSPTHPAPAHAAPAHSAPAHPAPAEPTGSDHGAAASSQNQQNHPSAASGTGEGEVAPKTADDPQAAGPADAPVAGDQPASPAAPGDSAGGDGAGTAGPPQDKSSAAEAPADQVPADQAPADQAPADQAPADRPVTDPAPTDLAPGGDHIQTNETSGDTAEVAQSTDSATTDPPAADQPSADLSVDQRAEGELSYTFGDTEYSNLPNVDVDGDGTPDGVLLDFDGSGNKDAIAWDSDGDGVVDTILVSSDHDGHYDEAYYDRGGEGRWSVTEKVSMTVGHRGHQTEHAETSVSEAAVTDAADPTDGAAAHQAGHQVTLWYSFGDSSTATQTYAGVADTDVDGDGVKDGIALDFDGSGHRDAVAWDSDGDGTVDTILVSSHHDGKFDLAYHDPTGNGHWSVAEPINGDVMSAGETDRKAADDQNAGAENGHPRIGPGSDHAITGGDHTGPGSNQDHPGAEGDAHADPGAPDSHADGSSAHEGTPAPEPPADDPSDPAGTNAGYDVGSNDDPYAHLADNNHSDGFLHGWQF
jgi:hypothetical protein